MKNLKKDGMLRLLILLFLMLPAASFAAGTGSSWVYSILDNGGADPGNDIGLFTDIAVDNNNKLHISYFDQTDGNLRYATNASGSWVLQDADPSVDYVGQYSSIAVDKDGKAHISYIDETNHALKYATNATIDSSWQFETVYDPSDTDNPYLVNFEHSIAIDKNGVIHISYYDSTHLNLKHAYGSLHSWTTETVDNGATDTGRYSSIAVDSGNIVHISYYDTTNGDLLYANNGDGWQLGAIDNSTSDDVGRFSSMVIDGNDTVHVSYYNATTGDLKYAETYSDGWLRETVDSLYNVGQFTSIAIDTLHNVWISYYDATNQTLRYASGKYGLWSTGQIDGTSGVGQYSAIVPDHTNRVHVSYYDTNNGGELKYASDGFPLTVTKNGTGSGVVMSDPPGINCGTPADCNEIYGDNTIVTLKAVPDAGCYFSGWTGCASSTMICKIKMDAAVNVNATFDTGLPPVTTWVKTYGDVNNDESSSIQQTSDGGFVVAGVKDIATGIGDAWVMKLSEDGTIDWQKTYANSYTDEAGSVQQTSDGGYIVAGETGFNVSGTGDFWILKLGADGSVTWQNTYGDGDYYGFQEIANSIVETFDGGYVVAGKTSEDIWIIKLDQNGNVIWQKSYGSAGIDRVSDIQQTSDGGYIAAGETADSVLVLKLNSFGDIIWQKSYGGAGYSTASSVRQTSDGGYIIAGLNSFSGDYDMWVLKLDGNGNVGPGFAGTWQKSYGTSGADEAAESVRPTPDGGYIVAGSISNNIWLLKLDQDGGVSWQHSYGNTSTSTEYASSIEQTRDGFIVSGTTYDGSSPEDLFLLKIDKNGDVNGCPIISTPTYSATGPSISVTNSSLYQAITSFSPATTSATITDTGVSPFTICSGPTVVSWLNPVDGNWDGESGLNWNTGTEPAVGDDVQIIVPCTGSCTSGYTVLLGTDAEINSLTIGDGGMPPGQILYVDGYALTLNNASIINHNGQITANNFTLNGLSTLAVDGILYLFGNNTINPSVSLGGGDVVANYGSNLLNGPLTTQNNSRLAVIAVTTGINARLAVAYGFTNNGLIELNYNINGPTASLLINSGTLINSATGVIQGRGTLDVSAAAFSNAGTINPGASPGILNITGNFSQQTSGVLNIEIGGTTGGSEYDQLNVSGIATLAGTLNVSLINSFDPPAGSSFTIMTYGSRSGNFNTQNLPALSGKTWSVSYGTSALTLTVLSTPSTYTLNVIKTGAGTGTVVSSEASAPLINCGTNCDYAVAYYPKDAQVKLKAAADAGSVFVGWGGACSGMGDCDLVMNASKSVSARFAINTLTISTQAGQGGSISPTVKTVNFGETALFTVTPDAGYHTVNVSGCGVTKYEGGVIAAKKKKKVKSSAAGEVYITGPITENCAISASFAINTFTVTPSAGEHGNINPSTQQTVNYNDTVPFSIKADDGYHIQSVSGCNGTAYTAAKKKKKKKLSAVLEMTYTTGHIAESCTVAASFAINTFTVTPKAGAHGSIDPSVPLTVNYLDTVSFTVKPDSGYHIESVTGCGVHPSEGGAYITDYVTGDCMVEAAFATETFSATILKSGTGSGTITGNGITCDGNACEGTFEAGSKLTLKIKPDDGYRVIDVKINGKSIGPIRTITLKEILSNFTIEIVFGPT